jgi:hypothetical protein
LAAKLARLEPKKIVLDLGSGKGSPSLLWASVFGVRVEARAETLNLSHRAKYCCKDIRELRLGEKSDVVASLGLGIAEAYGDIGNALKVFKTMFRIDSVLILAEPVWLMKPVSSEVLEAIGTTEGSLLTESEMQQLMDESEFQILGHFASTKEDWALYIRPTYLAMNEVVMTRSELAEEAQRVIDGFKAEYDAVGKHWNMILWVVKTR